ncbi:MAG: ABC transporter ATP-binding protein [Candidatus Latescibacteria bacterium]|nr:ABC transporter ATP-binding protein [Candidatus Latescibacterota bacterium]
MVSKIYSGRKGTIAALDSVSMHIESGEFIGVQGPSGSGKTTLLLAAGGLLIPDRGTVEISGNNLYSMPPEKRAIFRASEIGFVFQQFHLISYLTVLDNILVPSLAIPGSDASERARELLHRFNMTDRMHHTPSELSTGERQRTALARALLNKPKLILADEPTGNLDRENADIVLLAFDEFTKSGGAVLMVTHDETISHYAHRTCKLISGKIINNGE